METAGSDMANIIPVTASEQAVGSALDRGRLALRTYRQAVNDALIRLFDLTVALVFLPFALPLLAVSYVLHQSLNWRTGSFLYAGVRLGKHRRPFKIYKIRTLVPDAEQRLGAKLHKQSNGLEIRLGWFFRATHLDELPQIFCVIRGDMGVIGPRPIRPSVYEDIRDRPPEYDRRFEVRPGLVGYAQVHTPHSTPQRIKAAFDTQYAQTGKGPLSDFGLVLWTATSVGARVLIESVRKTRELLSTFGTRRSFANMRKLRRKRTRRVGVVLGDGTRIDGIDRVTPVLDMTEQTMRVRTDTELTFNVSQAICFDVMCMSGRKISRARCKGSVIERRQNARKVGNRVYHDYILTYEPLSEYGRYVIDRYALHDSVSVL